MNFCLKIQFCTSVCSRSACKHHVYEWFHPKATFSDVPTRIYTLVLITRSPLFPCTRVSCLSYMCRSCLATLNDIYGTLLLQTTFSKFLNFLSNVFLCTRIRGRYVHVHKHDLKFPLVSNVNCRHGTRQAHVHMGKRTGTPAHEHKRAQNV